MEQYQKSPVDIQSFNENAKSRIQKIVSESNDMITALECVGAMYGIAPTHIIAQPGLTSLKVVDDKIMSPPDVRPNTKAIVCSIGGVLDHISQRVNDKLDDNHDQETKEGRKDHPHVSTTANPSKGKVIERHVDSNGDEILIYDSGLMDMANTKEAHLKADELRQNLKVPMYNPDAMKAKEKAYFQDEDKIELEWNANIDFETFNSNDPKPTNISKLIQESAFHIDLISHYHDTDYLGYELLKDQGFDFVRPTESFALEAEVEDQKEKVNPDDIRHMKFDNTYITQAIRCFNNARAAQNKAGKGEFDITKFVSHPEYKKGINCLEKQFDCKLAVHFVDSTEKKNDLATMIFKSQHCDKIYVSKAKGFQLNGLPITIYCQNKAIDEEMQKDTDKDLFGQFMCSSLCHEIFHNIVNAIRARTNIFIYTTSSAMSMALSSQDAKTRRNIFEMFADTVVVDGKNLGHTEKKRLVKKLCYLSAIADNQKEVQELQAKIDSSKSVNEADQQIDALISKLEQANAKFEKEVPHMKKRGERYNKNPKGHKILHRLATALCCTGVGSVIGLPMLKMLPNKADAALTKAYDDYLKTPNKEEYYCDMFAGMYNLPITFTYGYTHRNIVANEIKPEKLQKLTSLEKNLYQYIMSTYPTDSERNYAGYQIAKAILDSGEDISPEVKKYCEWIVSHYSNIDKTNIDKEYNKTTFDPNEAKDLDQHVQNLILNNGLVVTESYKMKK